MMNTIEKVKAMLNMKSALLTALQEDLKSALRKNTRLQDENDDLRDKNRWLKRRFVALTHPKTGQVREIGGIISINAGKAHYCTDPTCMDCARGTALLKDID